MDETFGVNVHQDIQGCVEDFNKLHEPVNEPTPDPCEPNQEAVNYVRKGRLDPETGLEIPVTPKTRTAQVRQFGTPSKEYLRGYDMICWND